MMPADFIPVAERSGLIRQLTDRVLDKALTQCRAWRDAGLSVPIAVNISSRSLADPAFPDEVSTRVAAKGLSPSLLRLEITENVIMSDAGRSIVALGRLRDTGVSISIDDFGTGFSSLSYLHDFKVDELKLDRSFVSNIPTDEAARTIVRATIDLAHALGLIVVAEGVEDEQTLHALAGLHCDAAQGYFLSRPLTAAAITEYLLAHRRATRRGPRLVDYSPRRSRSW
jgi:EAL domain-containing protein (putative c-di-GMP-specific phosphodiesterase class I)